jgi:hypothetical protein
MRDGAYRRSTRSPGEIEANASYSPRSEHVCGVFEPERDVLHRRAKSRVELACFLEKRPERLGHPCVVLKAGLCAVRELSIAMALAYVFG